MRHTNRKRGLAIGLLVLAMAGCEDPPLTVPVPVAGASPGPSASPSGSPAPGASPVAASPTPAQSLAPGVSPTPVPTPTRTPTPTPTPTPTATASANTDAASQPITSLVFDAPTTASDFTASSVSVRVRAVVPTGVTLKEFALYYDGREHTKQQSSSLSLSTEWNPGVALTGKDNTPVPYGTHSLVAKATTTAGKTLELAYEFDKPLAFRGFTSQITTTTSLPPLPQDRGWVSLYGHEDNHQLFALFGRGANGQDMVAVQKLNLSDLGTGLGQWQYCNQGGLTPRHLPAVAGMKNQLYVIGGETAGATANLTPTDSVMAYNTATQSASSAPALPMALSDATAAVLGQYLYVFGGTSDGTATGASHRLYRLALNTDGSPAGTAWEAMATLPVAQARRGASMIAHRGQLYVFGGRNANDVLLPTIYRYTPSDGGTGPNTWEDAGALRTGFYHGAVGAIGTQVFLAGGVVDAAGTKSRTVVRYDSALRTVTTLAADRSLPTPRAGLGATVVGDKLYVVGGMEDITDTTTSTTVARPVAEALRANTL
ncbi:MAG: hypothetical protein ACK46X_01215 [Candidatus Sericytochromatia bacterium]